jgi:hypothetical protein
METKHLIALIAMVAASSLTILAATWSQRLRDLAFLVMVCFSIFAENFDVNFFGEYWYRGTSRGIGVSLTDVLAFSILVATWIAPSYPRRRWCVPMSAVLTLAYFTYCVFLTVNAMQPLFALWELVNIPRAFLMLAVGAAYLRTRREFGILVVGIAFTIGIQGVYALKQRYMGGIHRVPGTLDHPNSLSMYLCMLTPLLLAAAMSDWSKWLRWIAALTCGSAALSELLTISRAGLPIFGLLMAGVALACTTWEITRRKLMITLSIVAVVGVVVSKSWDQIKLRYESASFAEEYLDTQSEGRGVYLRWARAIADDHPYGVGLNNWSYAVSKTYGARFGFVYEDYDDIKVDPEKADLSSILYAAPAHSLAALTVGELGFPGLILFGLLWLRWFQVGAVFFWRRLNSDPLHRLGIGIFFGVLGVFLHSTTEWTYRQSTMFMTFHLMLGGLASLHYLRRHAPAPVEVEEEQEQAEELEIEATPMQVSATPNQR